MEELSGGGIVGTRGIASKFGGFEPFYSFRLQTTAHISEMLNLRKEVRTLHLVLDHNGPCEIGSLLLHPRCRHSGHGRTLSLARFMFMAEFPHWIDDHVIGEVRGLSDRYGRSPFWDAVGRHFFDLERLL